MNISVTLPLNTPLIFRIFQNFQTAPLGCKIRIFQKSQSLTKFEPFGGTLIMNFQNLNRLEQRVIGHLCLIKNAYLV